MHIPTKTLELRKKIFELQKCFRAVEKNETLKQRNGKMRDSICSQLNIDRPRYYRACLPLERIYKHTLQLRGYREKQSLKPFFLLKRKVRGFLKRGCNTKPFTYQDVINKFGQSPNCALTGLPVDYNDANSYQLDHIIPVSNGGESTIENLQIIHPIINKMKSDISVDTFISMCKKVSSFNSSCPF